MRANVGLFAGAAVLVAVACGTNGANEGMKVLSVDTAGIQTTTTLTPTADTFAYQSYPNTNYGTYTSFRSDGDPVEEAYLAFSVPPLTGTLTRATLRLYVTDGSTDGPSLYATETGWSELGLTWNNRPAKTSGPLATFTNIPTGWVDLDVTGFVQSGTDVSWALVANSANGIVANSKEGSNPPQLVIETTTTSSDGGINPDAGPPISLGINVGAGNALTLPAERHMVRIDPGDGQGAIWLLAVQQEGADGRGLGFFRSDDEGSSFQYMAPIQDDWSERDTTDLERVGNDVAMTYGFEGPTLSGDTRHDVYFQWWRYQAGTRSFSPSTAVKVFDSTSSSQAFSRAELAIDGAGRIWVHAFELLSDGSSAAAIAVSTDGGQSFTRLANLDTVPNRGGGRLLHLSGELVFVYAMHDGFLGTHFRIHKDSDPVGTWGPVTLAFSEGIYHGAALSAVAAGPGMHLVYKNENDEMLYYRWFDGASFGPATQIDDSSDWALQPAITLVGSDLFVFYNHYFTSTRYDFRYRKLHAGSFSSATVLDSTTSWKGYPNTLSTFPSTAARISAVYGSTPDANSSGVLKEAFAPGPGPGTVTDGGTPDAGTPDAGSDGGTVDGGARDGGTSVLVLGAAADTYARQDYPDRNFGSSSRLWSDTSPNRQLFVRFDVPTLSAPLLRATLRLYVVDGTTNGPSVYGTSAAWDESTLTWNNMPATNTPELARLVTVPRGWVEYDVTPAVTLGGAASFTLVPHSSNGMGASSKEAGASVAPQLVLETAGP